MIDTIKKSISQIYVYVYIYDFIYIYLFSCFLCINIKPILQPNPSGKGPRASPSKSLSYTLPYLHFSGLW